MGNKIPLREQLRGPVVDPGLPPTKPHNMVSSDLPKAQVKSSLENVLAPIQIIARREHHLTCKENDLESCINIKKHLDDAQWIWNLLKQYI